MSLTPAKRIAYCGWTASTSRSNRARISAALCPLMPSFTSTSPTGPGALEWSPIAGIFRGTVHLRMHITPGNLSEELLDAIRHTRYPDADVPEVLGLRRVLEAACARAGVALRLDPGP